MAMVRVQVELRAADGLEARPPEFAPEAPTQLDASALPESEAITFDPTFAPLAMPQVRRADEEAPLLAFAPLGEPSTYLARAVVDEDAIGDLRARPEVVEVFSDPVVEPCIVCPGDPAVGTDADVEQLLCSSLLNSSGLDGSGVLVAIVDTGINVAHLAAHGKSPQVDVGRSWKPASSPPGSPGQWPVGHGTMCAYDVLITAPRCTLLDVAVLQSQLPGPTAMSGVLSDAVAAYRHLIDIMAAPRRPGETRSLVVNNSWGMYHPSWDFPANDPGNYSDNPDHPFNRIVAELELAGADILFAAGNCGANCPDGRCQGVTNNAIYGANSHPSVLCVAGVDITKTRVGYSTIGPGRLEPDKPDVAGYTHFTGSGVYPADGGTSAATPVVSGVVGALRSTRPYQPGNAASQPAAIRALLRSTAEDLGAPGYDPEYGHGVVAGCALLERLPRPKQPSWLKNLCKRYPWLCDPEQPPDICKLFPRLCEPRPKPFPPKPPWNLGVREENATPDLAELAAALGADEENPDLVELSYAIGWLHGQSARRLREEP